jgi:hypothetical protein
MSQPSRPQERRPARRKDRRVHLGIQRLEERQVLAPIVTVNTPTVTLTNVVTTTAGNLSTTTGDITLTFAPNANSAAAFTSVAQLTSLRAFGGDMVRIQAGPGGDFGKGVYAISRGAGANANPDFRDASLPTPINRPGVIYRVDPATGRSSVFFDLNTVLNQIDPGAAPGNGALPGTGLVNWYDIAFDPEGIFDGRPSMFVTSLSNSDPQKNAVYRIGPDGSFLGLYMPFPVNPATAEPTVQPSAILVPPVEQQGFLRGVLVGNANSAAQGGGGAVLFFDANVYRPGTPVLGPSAAQGVSTTGMLFNPQVGITNANALYVSPAYSVFTDFGVPPSPITPPAPGLSGVQGLRGDILIGNSLNPQPNVFGVNTFQRPDGNYEYYTLDTDAANPDTNGVIPTPFRRFQDVAFDSYSFFSYGASLTTTGGVPTATPIPPTYAGSLFVADLGTGLSANLTGGDQSIFVPVQGPGSFTITVDTTPTPNLITDLRVSTANIGGRVIRIGPDGVVTPFASNFHTPGSLEADSFLNGTLSLTFSADGTTLYVADMDGIWQFKTVTSLAGSTTGSLIGLNDLRSFGVPYEGQDQAVAIVDTGVDAGNPFLRGRVAPGRNLITNGRGDDDTAGVVQGHGTAAAGVVTQFVPQATLVPVNVFTPNTGAGSPIPGGTTAQILWNGLKYITQNPFVKDPVRPNSVDRTVAATFGFGTVTAYQTEGEAYRASPQVVLALKNQFNRFRRLGIAPIAAAGQFGTDPGGTANTTNGEALPAGLNEVISVSGTYSFPFASDARSLPTDPSVGALPRPLGPVLVTDTTGAIVGADLIILTAGDPVIFSDRVLANANRSIVTDYVAPALNIPTYARVVTGVTTTDVGGAGLMLFQEGGTSLSSAIVTGSFSVVASALQYWVNIARSGGVTVDGYLTTPVGVRQLNFGPHQIGDLSTYLTPDGVNSILQWTAVPVRDEPTTLDVVAAPQLFPNAGGPWPQRSRIDVGNAVAAIEGTIALNYLIRNGYMDIIDANKNGLITAQELQTFVDTANVSGMPEAGALARFLGGTARLDPTFIQSTGMLEDPEQNDVLQRRYNFFDYAADGNLDGVISIDQYKMLAKNLMPAPDAFVVVDRQRSSGNGYLLDPRKERNYVALQYTKPKFAFVPAGIARRYRNVSPQRFGVGLREIPGVSGPQFTLFAPKGAKTNRLTARPGYVAPAKPTPTGGSTNKPTTGQQNGGQQNAGEQNGGQTSGGATNGGTYQQQAVDSFLDRLRQALGGNNNGSSNKTTLPPSTSK